MMVYHGILNIGPCAVQQDLVVYPFHIQQFGSANPKLQVYLLFMQHISVESLLHVWHCLGAVDRVVKKGKEVWMLLEFTF